MSKNIVLDAGAVSRILSLPAAITAKPCFAEARQELRNAEAGLNSNCPKCRQEAADSYARAARMTKDCLRSVDAATLAAIKQSLVVDSITLIYASVADPRLSTQFVI